MMIDDQATGTTPGVECAAFSKISKEELRLLQKGGLADKILDKLSYVRNSMNLVTFYTDNGVFLKMSKHGNPEKLSARSQCVYGTVVFHSHERSSAVTALLCKNDERA